MKKFVMPAMFALAVSAGPALAADMVKPVYKAAPPVVVTPWDVAIGAAIATDYNFRGISQSNRGASPSAYFEARYNSSKDVQWYAGIAGLGIDLATHPSAEIDLYGGVRPTFGPLAFDFGFLYYWYPRETQYNGINNIYSNGTTTLANSDFWEVYAKAVYTFNDNFNIGANVYYADSWLNTGASGTFASATAKYTGTALANGWGWYLSGEIGYYWLGTPDIDGVLFTAANLVNLPDYTTWNVGMGFTYKAITVDLRYYDTDLSKENCWILTSDYSATFGGVPSVGNPTGLQSKWCNAAFVGKLAFDTTLNALK